MAANAFTTNTTIPRILARGLLALREMAVMPRLVNIDYGTDARRPGSSVDIPLPVAQSAGNVTAAPTYSSAQGNTPQVVSIPLDQWKHTDFYLTDKERGEIEASENYMPQQMSEGIRALANLMDVRCMSPLYKGIYGFVGTAGVSPFSTVATATDARKVLNQQLAPLDNRRVVLDPTAESQALQLAAFSNFEQTGDMDVKIEGTIGRKFGMDFYMDQNMVTHTAGTATGTTAAVGSTTAVGASTLDIKNQASAGIGTILIGDIFTIAGDTQTYVVQTSTVTFVSALTASAVSIDPPLKVIASANAVITFKGTHVVNLAFNRNAIAFVTRPLESDSTQTDIATAVDPVTGLSLRIEKLRQYKQTAVDLDCLYGAQLIRPALACRIGG